MDASRYKLLDLRNAVKPFRLHWFTRLRSTNDHAALLRKRRELFAPAIVLAGNQVAGRGRGGNAWWSGCGSLTVTFALPIRDHVLPHQVPLLAGLAVREALSELSGSADVQLKWPNDLLLGDRKLAGLLCERISGVDLIGVGVNVNVDPRDVPSRLRHQTATLLQASAGPIGMNDVVISLAQHINARLSRRDGGSFAHALKEYDRHHALVGRTVAVTDVASGLQNGSVSGVVVGLDSIGRLLVRDRGSLHRVISGHIAVR